MKTNYLLPRKIFLKYSKMNIKELNYSFLACMAYFQKESV